MSLSLYQVSVVPFIAELKIVSKLLTKGLEHVKGDESALIDARIIEDMQPLTYQVSLPRSRQAKLESQIRTDLKIRFNASATQLRVLLSAWARSIPSLWLTRRRPSLSSRSASPKPLLS